VQLHPHLGVQHRQAESYQAQATLFVTQPRFPWGRTVTQYIPGNSAKALPSLPTADEDRLATLTALYAQLAVAAPIRAQLQVDQKLRKLSVAPVAAPPYVNPAILPLLTVTAVTPTPAGAVDLANRAATTFQQWLARQQAKAGIPADLRVTIQIVDPAAEATFAAHRSKTLPAVIFLGLIAATFGFVFVRENLNPRVPATAQQTRPFYPTRIAS
jgi:hypothetical protein